MSKHQKKKGLARHVRLYHWMLNTEAWKDLSAVAKVIYIELERRYYGSNNGLIHYSTREAARDVKISKGTAARALRELQAHGFIVVEKMGAFHLKMRHASEYRLTAHDSNVEGISFQEKFATKEFLRWPEIQNTVPLMRLSGRVVRPIGPRSDTVVLRTSSDGPLGDTVKTNFG
jgi:hypothetical protein